MKKEKINSFSLSTLIVATSGASIWGILTSYLAYNAKNACIISIIIGFVLDLIISKILLNFFNIYPDLKGADKVKKILGKFSIVFNLIFTLCGIVLFIIISYRLASFLSSQYLTSMPNYYFYLLIILLSYYISSKGMETITRVSVISFYLSIFLFLFNLFCLINLVNFDNFLPLFTVSFKSILKSGIIFGLLFLIPTLYVLGYKKNNIVDKEKFNKHYYFMLTWSFIVILISIFVTIGIYGINLTNLFNYPLYTVLIKIKLFSFLDSIENVSVMLWILYTINASTAILYSLMDNINLTFNLDQNKIVNISILTITFIIPIIFLENNNFVETFKYLKIPIITTIVILFSVLIINIISKIKNKK